MSRYLDRLKALTNFAERHLPKNPTKLTEGAFGGFVVDAGRRVSGNDRPADTDEAEIEYRKGMSSDSVPDAYIDAWARLQIQRPATVAEIEWRRTINDAGLFLDVWGSLAVQFQWSPGDLFDLPRDGRQGGLAWFLKSELVRALGPEHAVTASGKVFDRLPLGYVGEKLS